MASCCRQQSKLDPTPEFSHVKGKLGFTQAAMSQNEPSELAEEVQELVVENGCGVRQPSGCADREVLAAVGCI